MSLQSLATKPGLAIESLAMGAPPATYFGPVQWAYLRDAAVDGSNVLYRTSGGSGFGTSGGNSSEQILPGDGALQFEIDTTWFVRFMCGLSDDRAEIWTGIEFGFYARDNGVIYSVENTTLTNLGTWSNGDTIKIDIRSGVAKLYQNAGLIHTYAAAASGPFWVCADLYQLNSAVVGGEILA